jgi:hypothetical protein
VRSMPSMCQTAALSADADRLLRHFRSMPIRWVVLNHASTLASLGIAEAKLSAVVSELEEAGLVERASHGPLLFLNSES